MTTATVLTKTVTKVIETQVPDKISVVFSPAEALALKAILGKTNSFLFQKAYDDLCKLFPTAGNLEIHFGGYQGTTIMCDAIQENPAFIEALEEFHKV